MNPLTLDNPPRSPRPGDRMVSRGSGYWRTATLIRPAAERHWWYADGVRYDGRFVANGVLCTLLYDFDTSTPLEGGETTMETITINGATFRLVPVSAEAAGGPALTILHPWAVYRLDGTRLDGYADRARAIRRGTKFLGKRGFFLVNMNEATTEFVPASR